MVSHVLYLLRYAVSIALRINTLVWVLVDLVDCPVSFSASIGEVSQHEDWRTTC